MFKTLLAPIAILALLGAMPVAAQPKAEPLSVETFFKNTEFRDVAISPNGKYIAALSPFKGRYNVAVFEIAKRGLYRTTSFEKFDVGSFQWVSNERLVVNIVSNINEVAADVQSKGTFALDADGGNPREMKYRGFQYLGTPDFDSDEIIAAMRQRRRDAQDVYKVNTRTGRIDLLTFDAPEDTYGWVLDRDFVPRAVQSRTKGDYAVWYRASASAPWQKFSQQRNDEARVTPVAFDWDGKTAYVSSSEDGDRRAIYKFDLTTMKRGELLFDHPQVDIGGGNLVFNRALKKLLGVRYMADTPGVKWFDPELDKLQKQVDASMKGTVNTLSIPTSNPDVILVHAFSDRSPGSAHLFDRNKFTLEKLVEFAPWIKPEQMAERKAVRYKARDGLEIPAYLTLPPGSNGKNLPLVINIHGGPNVRGETWGWSPEDQFLASRGYAVLSPNFRGTTGYGRKHRDLGYKNWGKTMQDDLVDGMNWAVTQGIADKSKVCLYGASYGGYATLFGLARDPELFKCGVAFVAVSDINLLFDVQWSDTAQGDVLEYEMTERIGDPKNKEDRAYFDSVSAVKAAGRIRAPLMLAYGADDVRVPLIHGEKMKAALDQGKKKYEWVVYDGEGHGWNKTENRYDWYKRVDKFLAESLK